MQSGDNVYSVTQDLSTANALWDIATATCGFLVDECDLIIDKCIDLAQIANPPPPPQPLRIIEIGAGTGLLSIVAAKELGRELKKRKDSSCIFSSVQVVITDLPQELDTIKENVLANFPNLEFVTEHTDNVGSSSILVDKQNNCSIRVEPLSWGNSEDLSNISNLHSSTLSTSVSTPSSSSFSSAYFHLILASDVVYELQHFDLLFSTLHQLIPSSSRHPTSSPLFLMGTERRWSDVDSLFHQGMMDNGFRIINKNSLSNDIKSTNDQRWWTQIPQLEILLMDRVKIEKSSNETEELEDDLDTLISKLKALERLQLYIL